MGEPPPQDRRWASLLSTFVPSAMLLPLRNDGLLSSSRPQQNISSVEKSTLPPNFMLFTDAISIHLLECWLLSFHSLVCILKRKISFFKKKIHSCIPSNWKIHRYKEERERNRTKKK